MVSMTCQKCGKVFEHKFQSKVNERYNEHAARVNPCVREEGTPYVMTRSLEELEPVKGLDELDVSGIVLSDHVRYVNVLSNTFGMLMDIEPFACIPNVDRNIVWYILEGKLCRSPIHTFVDIWIRHVFLPKICPHLSRTWAPYGLFSAAIYSGIHWTLGPTITKGEWTFLRRSAMIRIARDAILGHLSRGSKAARTRMKMRVAMTPETLKNVAVDIQ